MTDPYDAGFAAGRTWAKREWKPLPIVRMAALINPLMKTPCQTMAYTQGFDSGYEDASLEAETPE